VTPLYPQKLALTSPTGGGRSVGIVRSRTKATEELTSILQPVCNTLANYRLRPVPSPTTVTLGICRQYGRLQSS